MAITQRTSHGQQITIMPENWFPVRLDLQGIYLIDTLNETSVLMSLQDARELHAALGKALKRYDKERHDKQARADWVELFGSESKPCIIGYCPSCKEHRTHENCSPVEDTPEYVCDVCGYAIDTSDTGEQ